MSFVAVHADDFETHVSMQGCEGFPRSVSKPRLSFIQFLYSDHTVFQFGFCIQ